MNARRGELQLDQLFEPIPEVPETAAATLPPEQVVTPVVDGDAVLQQTDEMVAQLRKGKCDVPDIEVRLVWNSTLMVAATPLGLMARMLDPRLQASITAAAVVVNAAYTGRCLLRGPKGAEGVTYGNYRLQNIYTRRAAGGVEAGQVVTVVHPPTEDEKEHTVAYDPQRLTLLDALSKSDIDGVILPLSPKQEATATLYPTAASLKEILTDLKGFELKLPYADNARGVLLTKPELQELVARERVSSLQTWLRQQVGLLYPSATALLNRQTASPNGALGKNAEQYAAWDKRQRLMALERLLASEWQATQDDVTRVRQPSTPAKELFVIDRSEAAADAYTSDYIQKHRKEYLSPVVQDGRLGFRDQQQILMHQKPIDSLAELDENPTEATLVAIQSKMQTGEYSRLQLLSLAWQAEQLPGEQSVAEQLDPTIKLHPRTLLHARYKEAYANRTELRRLGPRVGAIVLSAALLTQAPAIIESFHNQSSLPPFDEVPTLYVEAHGNMPIEGYYSQQSFYDLDGSHMVWYDNYPQVKSRQYPDNPGELPNYLAVQQVVQGSYGFASLAVKQDTELVGLRVSTEAGPLKAKVKEQKDGIQQAAFPAVDEPVQLTYYLAPADGQGGVDPSRPLQIGGPQPYSNTSLTYAVSTEALADTLATTIPYDAGDKTMETIYGATAADFADRVLLNPEAHIDCEAATDVLALNQAVVAPQEPAARVTGYYIKDTETPGQEYASNGHAWLATDRNPYLDGTPALAPGQSRADAGLDAASQEALADEWGQTVSPFPDTSSEDGTPFPWEPLSLAGGLAVAGLAVSQRRRLGLYAGLTADMVRTKLPGARLTPQAFRNLVAHETYADPDGQQMVDGRRFAELRQRIESRDGITEASVTDEALRRVVERQAPLIQALLSRRERRAFRTQAAGELRRRQWTELRRRRQVRKAAKRSARLAHSTEEINE